ncbi:helix-turn-helix domain-containing protein [Bermanella marisrubri]
MRSKYEQGLSKSKLAQEYGVSRMTIMRAISLPN